MAVASVGVVIGTLMGERVHFGIPRARSTQVVSALIGVLGVWLLVAGGG